ncbi:MAG: hypothetical protein V1723_02115 [Candidatus Uhrbacteria bacterium]
MFFWFEVCEAIALPLSPDALRDRDPDCAGLVPTEASERRTSGLRARRASNANELAR